MGVVAEVVLFAAAWFGHAFLCTVALNWWYGHAVPRPLLKAVMKVLQEAFPATVPFDILRKSARERIGGCGLKRRTVMN